MIMQRIMRVLYRRLENLCHDPQDVFLIPPHQGQPGHRLIDEHTPEVLAGCQPCQRGDGLAQVGQDFTRGSRGGDAKF